MSGTNPKDITQMMLMMRAGWVAGHGLCDLLLLLLLISGMMLTVRAAGAGTFVISCTLRGLCCSWKQGITQMMMMLMMMRAQDEPERHHPDAAHDARFQFYCIDKIWMVGRAQPT